MNFLPSLPGMVPSLLWAAAFVLAFSASSGTWGARIEYPGDDGSVTDSLQKVSGTSKFDYSVQASEYWKTDGNKIVDSYGTEVWFTGMTWYGFDGSYCIADGIPFKLIDQHFDLIQQLGFNFIRIPFSTVCVDRKMFPSPRQNFSHTPYQNLTSLEILDLIVQKASSLNIRVALFWMLPNLDLPESDPTKQGIWFNDLIDYATEDYWIQTLQAMAFRYRKNANLVGMGLFNEPHDHPSHPDLEWSPHNESPYNWYRAAKRAGDAIHAFNPNLLIFVQGLSDSRNKDFPYVWWGSGMATVSQNLLNLTVPNRVVYEVHDFGPLTYRQEYFNLPGFQTLLPSIWDNAWGFLSQSNKAPILIGEFGTTIEIQSVANNNTDELDWFLALIEYIKANSFRWTVLQWGSGGRHGGLLEVDLSSPICDKLNALLPIFHPSFQLSPFPLNPEYLKLCPNPSNMNSFNGKSLRLSAWMILLIIILAFITFSSILIIFLFSFKGKLYDVIVRMIRKNKRPVPDILTLVKFFPLKDLISATENFSKDKIVGNGGFGTVYKGITEQMEIIAVKRLNEVDSKSVSMFYNEVNLISRMNHSNVVKLLGFCDEYNEQILVYEFMANGTLRDHLHPGKKFPPLSFDQRLKIALSSSQGIEYLHKHVTENIYHRDIKSENILLDENFQAKISDFGLSKIVPNEMVEVEVMNVVGTLGYLDPEYLTSLNFTAKSDVYSFGVVLLELITGRYPTFIDESNGKKSSLPTWVYSNLDDLSRIMDPNLEENYPIEQASLLLRLALSCVQRSGINRPTMSCVTRQLTKISSCDHKTQEDESSPIRPKHLHYPSSGSDSQFSFNHFLPSLAPHHCAER